MESPQIDILAEEFSTTHLGGDAYEREQLPFNPLEGSGLAPEALNNVPRYLFRIASPYSDGKTNATWVRSEAACQRTSSSREDIFSNLTPKKQTKIAHILNLHLNWKPKAGWEDNFVSWTSSLPFAIQYIYYRHQRQRDQSRVENIQLYIVDTTLFPRGTFLRDLDLIDTFRDFDDHPKPTNLESLRELRTKGGYYFGEWLSQGSLKIANKNQTISAACLFNDNGNLLRRLQPHFANIGPGSTVSNPSWANEVRRLRQTIWENQEAEVLPSEEMHRRLHALASIVELFQPAWRFPLAIYFAALIGPTSVMDENDLLLMYFRSRSFHEEQSQFRPSKFAVVPETMPELIRVRELVREVYKHAQLSEALSLVSKAKKSIRILHILNKSPEGERAFTVNDSNGVLDSAGQRVLVNLEAVQTLCEQLIQTISRPNEE